ncbi:MAG: ABC transporter ATP-binding protein [Bacteroidetes bacterium]|nr:ABC transporter ATP-binding protein [Bacteroidota bacterium]MBS1540431.1 ABC transporter ATP-binding protein [Bacteroidota bacterium]
MGKNKVFLHTKNLCAGYRHGAGKNILLENVSVSLLAGTLTCFMGPNGIGKSTLIRTLAGLQPTLGGALTNVGSKKMALVLTDKISSTNMTVYDLVSYGRYPYVRWGISFSKDDHRLIAQAISEVQIESLADKRLEGLSDGQLQLAMIARALAQETPIILLDEPTAHLDLNNRVKIMKLLQRLAHEKEKAILVATHELDLALQLADTIWLATPDKKIITGMPEDLVLDNSFDNIFQFKGFDLKTGKIQHKPFRSQQIKLIGAGHQLLWTKNAFEREGYLISDEGDTVEIISETASWKYQGNSFSSLQSLMEKISVDSV